MGEAKRNQIMILGVLIYIELLAILAFSIPAQHDFWVVNFFPEAMTIGTTQGGMGDLLTFAAPMLLSILPTMFLVCLAAPPSNLLVILLQRCMDKL